MKAVVGSTVVAEAPTEDLVKIEGNWYFPPSSLADGAFEKSPTAYHCPWKGDAQYWNVGSGDDVARDGGWSYPDPIPTAFDRVGSDFSGYVAFDRSQVSIEE
ncbi:DUF427 domain-containing protein [Aeromicrobium yanjiei]|uniref:DUF427 domain-containing protein n=1 Tax=Aeromicrobium yanjiei TaxID=2662028 RepID=A0A5Q2MIM9_9ACTN|nr:DUF427 domain-containing protein [Aeromicrobium yanjiei]QGG42528.1 DUF427 domain-containing protein [Aeromicrobium yanjiei]